MNNHFFKELSMRITRIGKLREWHHQKIRVIRLFAKFAFPILLAAAIITACGTKSTTTPQPTSPAPTSIPTIDFKSGEVILLSMEENGYAHFFLYTPDGQPILRLTDGNSNDIAPALSPDGTQVAFASDRSGYWDIYLLILATGETRQITNTPTYDSAPTWSPDSQWLAYETYDGNDIEIAAVQLTVPDSAPIFLTDDPAADISPAWSPQGRQIAFISNRSGNPDVWLADLDQPVESRFTNLSNTLYAAERRPLWAENRLLWVAEAQGVTPSGAYVWDADQPERPARWITDADWATWNPSKDKLALVLHGPNQDYFSASSLDESLPLPPRPLPGLVRGLLWLTLDLPNPPEAYRAASAMTPPALWSPEVTPLSEGPTQRQRLVDLPNVQAPYPQLHDQVDEAFTALRQRVVEDAGWDALASLQNAYVPLTSPLDPGLGEDWLYTGRAFELNSLLTNAGWMVAVREEVGLQTFWRIFIRAQNQDGSQGQPLHEAPWDLNARYNLDPQAYDQGGAYAPIPNGYWVDFTALARAYGWERVPSLPNWRSYFGGTRFTEFVLTGGLDWYSAMLEIYPSESLVTPTPRLPPTLTPTLTLVATITPGPSPTPTISPSPTSTPVPTATLTPVPSLTPLPSNTPLP
jgi:TolB protein